MSALRQALAARAKPNTKRSPRRVALRPGAIPSIGSSTYDGIAWHLVLPMVPSANELVAPVFAGGRARLVKTRVAKSWVAMVKMILARGDRGPRIQGPIRLMVAVEVSSITRDLSNCLKQLEDALKGHCWNDDLQVTEIRAQKRITTGFPKMGVIAMPCGTTTDDETSKRIFNSKAGAK